MSDVSSEASALTIAVTPSIRLRPSQAKLYAFITHKFEAGETISLPEVVKEYAAYGNRNKVDGRAGYYAYDWSEHRSYRAVLSDNELKVYAIQWFIRNLGVFVVKGLLTAIPTMNLEDIEVETDDGEQS